MATATTTTAATPTAAAAIAAVKQDCKTISISRAPLFVVFKFYSALLTGAQRKEQRQLHAVLTKKINTNCALHSSNNNKSINSSNSAVQKCNNNNDNSTHTGKKLSLCVSVCLYLVTTEAAAALRLVFQHYPHIPTLPPSANTVCLFTHTHTVASEQVANKTT